MNAEHFGAGMSEDESTDKSRNRQAPAASLSEHISQNVADIVELQRRESATSSTAQRRLERISHAVARPGYVLALLLFTLAWVATNLLLRDFGSAAFDPPPFQLLQGLLTLTALLTATVVLIGQSRQRRLTDQREHLDLQINLLTEQKVSKLIHMLEELRRDLPMVRDRERSDPHVSALQEPTDAAEVLSAMEDTGLTKQPGTGNKSK
jgi:uncharacterized membrane protein